VQEVIDTVKAVTGRDFEVITAARRAGDPARLVADPSLANRVLRWKARYDDLNTIVQHAWAWHQKHERTAA
jgi:UDP-glucose 4-epimerase